VSEKQLESNPEADPQVASVPIGKVLRLAVRTLPYLKSARRDILRLALIVVPLAIALVPLGMMGYDLLINKLLQGEAVTGTEARLLRLDPAVFVDVERLSLEARQTLRGKLVTIFFVIFFAGTPIALGLIFYVLQLLQRINQSLRVQMMEQVQAMSMRHHSGTRVGDSIYHAYQDSSMVTNMMAMLVRPLGPLLRLVTTVAIVTLLDARLAAGLIGMYVVAFFVARYFGWRLRGDFKRARELNTTLTARIQETLSGLKVVKAFGAEGYEQQRFEESSEGAFRGAYQARSRLALFGVITFCIATLPAMAAFCFMAVWAHEERSIAASVVLAFAGFSAWSLGAFTYANGRMGSGVNAVRSLLAMWGMVQDMAVGMERAFSQVDLKPEVEDKEGAESFKTLQQDISFEAVDFAYQPERPVLQGVNLTAKAGQITALVGPTGSGKSTLVSLLLRLFDPDGGRVAIDGKDIRGFTIDSLRAGVAIALQENLLFGTTIGENIRYAVPEASDEAVRAAARVACADEYIVEQPEGYDTPLGERGTKLSTGQRQRLSIARAIIKDTPVLVLDEPTASLDADTELRVLRNLHQWGEGRAIFLITHRLSTIRQADHIVYLREGQVIEQGSHDGLMAKEGGAYRRFVELEQGNHEAGSARLASESLPTPAVGPQEAAS